MPMPTSSPLAISLAERAMHEFCNQWFSGLQPSLTLETAPDGSIRVSSRVIAGHVATPHPYHAHHHHHHAGKARNHRRGPSYHRRLQRRAAARTSTRYY